tara:strand:- start:616 stop:813 length:198 start_codon:yes stop_codon:yes gene_type:complete
MQKKLQQYKYHYNYAKQYGDTDLQVIYFNKIQDLLAQEIYSEFGYDTCKMVEKEEILTKTINLLN